MEGRRAVVDVGYRGMDEVNRAEVRVRVRLRGKDES